MSPHALSTKGHDAGCSAAGLLTGLRCDGAWRGPVNECVRVEIKPYLISIQEMNTHEQVQRGNNRAS